MAAIAHMPFLQADTVADQAAFALARAHEASGLEW